MIRVIKTDDQIIEGQRGFALYDTVSVKFVDVDGDQQWETADELAQSFEYLIDRLRRSRQHTQADFETVFRDRCVGLARGNGY